MSTTIDGSVGGTRAVASVGGGDQGGEAAPLDGQSLLPAAPPVMAEDMVAALAMMTIKQKQTERANADKQRIASEKAQEEAHATKIEKMRELAKDSFWQGFAESLFDGLSAAASGTAALTEFSTRAHGHFGPKAKATVSVEEAVAKDLGGKGKLAGAIMKSSIEGERADLAEVDARLDRAKRAVDAAGAASGKAQDEIKETINAIRGYLAAKTQLGQAAIIRG